MRKGIASMLLGTLVLMGAYSAAAFATERNPYECARVHPAFGIDGHLTTPASVSIQGNTPAEVHARFPVLIEQNFHSGDAGKLVRNLSDRELADLAYLYGRATTGNTSPLLDILASKVDANGLNRLAAAFGEKQVTDAVARHAPASVAATYSERVPYPSFTSSFRDLAYSSRFTTGAGPAPNIDMTPQEIYLEFRTAPVGSLSIASSLAETAIFMASRLIPAAGAGASVGYAVNYLIETYDPSLDDAIGGTIDSAVQNIDQAASYFEQGEAEKGVDTLFGLPISDSGDPNGDFDVSGAMGAFEGSSGSGC